MGHRAQTSGHRHPEVSLLTRTDVNSNHGYGGREKRGDVPAPCSDPWLLRAQQAGGAHELAGWSINMSPDIISGTASELFDILSLRCLFIFFFFLTFPKQGNHCGFATSSISSRCLLLSPSPPITSLHKSPSRKPDHKPAVGLSSPAAGAASCPAKG